MKKNDTFGRTATEDHADAGQFALEQSAAQTGMSPFRQKDRTANEQES
ncbi:MAG: hypothetical protein ACFCUT_21625 [Kiloniellaceae bacterium]